MADATPPGLDRAAAIELIGNHLTGTLGAMSLGAPDVGAYRQNSMTHGWRLSFVTAGQEIVADLVIDAEFPISQPDIFWVNAPPFPSIPHVEPDGRICILPSIATIDPLKPIAVLNALLSKLEDVIGKGLRGENADDFRTEFRSYWNHAATGRTITSIVDPCEPSRIVSAWIGEKTIVVAENSSALRRWLQNAFGKNNVANVSLHRVPLIWLPQPLVPSEYPTSEADIAHIAAQAGENSQEIYERGVTDEVETTLVLFGADSGSNAICFGGAALSRKTSRFTHSDRRVKGFRDRIPQKLLRLSRHTDHVALCPVERADPWWVHGRDTQDDLETLLAARVAIIGCGSLGSPIARHLAQAGVGRLVLIDPEIMSHANAGRHTLGIDAVNRSKAAALRDRLCREFPHLAFEAYSQEWQAAAEQNPDLLPSCDLIISSIGNWEAECSLNQFRLSKTNIPPIIFTWSEPHAAGGHAVVIGSGGGCFACGLKPDGNAVFRIATFEGTTLRREPACGAYFQPYGGADIAAIASLGAKTAIEQLNEILPMGHHRAVARSAEDISALGGSLSVDWIASSEERALGANEINRHWAVNPACGYCQGNGA